MSRENVEVVRQFLATFIEVDEALVEPGRLHEFFVPDAPLDLSGIFELAGRRETRGVDEFLEWRNAWFAAYDDYIYSAEKILDAGANGVVVTFHQQGKPHGSDSWVEMDYAIVYVVEEGLITRGKVYGTHEEALEAAGLRE
jgi:hypothetical protein